MRQHIVVATTVKKPEIETEINLPIRFGQHQITKVRNIETPGMDITATQNTKNAWQAIEFNQTRKIEGSFLASPQQSTAVQNYAPAH